MMNSQLRALLQELEEAGRENDARQQDRSNKMLISSTEDCWVLRDFEDPQCVRFSRYSCR